MVINPFSSLKNSRGQVFVETAIVLPLAFLLLFLLLEGALLFTAHNALSLGTFRAARSFISTGHTASAEEALTVSLKPVFFQPGEKPLTYLEVNEQGSHLKTSSVFLYQPLFPIRKMAQSFSSVLFPAPNKPLIDRAKTTFLGKTTQANIDRAIFLTTSMELIP